MIRFNQGREIDGRRAYMIESRESRVLVVKGMQVGGLKQR